ncbi:MAG: AMP-binding protein [Opitutales bacterium]|nr:AMP-binding protein [Opitutales bacterium]
MPEDFANVARFLPLRAAENPHMCAIRVPCGMRKGEVLYQERSFAELNADVDACARLLEGEGITRGTRTLLMVKQGLELIVCTFAMLKVGAVPVIIDPGMGLKSFLSCVRRTGPEALVGIPLAQRISRLFRKSFSTVRSRLSVDGDAFWRNISLNRTSETFAMARTRPDELAAILFTSGSTGAPKGVRYLHGMFEAQFRLLDKLYHFEAGEVNMPLLPVFALFNPALGMTSVIPDLNPSRPAKANGEKLVAALLQNRVSNSFGSPVLWRIIADCCEKHDIRLPALRTILMAGCSVPAELVRRMKSIAPYSEVFTPYGATEGLPLASISGSEILDHAELAQKLGAGSCVGMPAPEIELACIPVYEGALESFVDTMRVRTGEIGEIVATGPVVTHEYDLLPEATAAAKMRDAQGRVWHRMGDLGRFDEEGRLWFCGRKAERVVTETGTLYTDCCEGVFNAHPDVLRTALIGIRKGGKIVPAIAVEPKKGKFPLTRKAKADLVEELLVLGKERDITREIDTFFFERKFPVDVRHNAKIHRLTLARKHSDKV